MSSDSLKALVTIAQIIQKSKPSENPLSHIVMMVREQMSVDVCSLYLLQDKTLVLVATDGLDSSSIGCVRMKVHEGLTGLAVEKLQPVIVKEASLHPRFKYFPETGEEKFHTFVAVPLFEKDVVVGVLTIQTVLPRDFDPRQIEFLKLIAFQLGGVVHNLVTLEVLCEERGAQKKKSIQLRGIPVAPGFGIGSAFCIRPGVEPIIMPRGTAPFLKPAQEWKRLQEAVKKASQDLLRLEKRLEKKFSKKEADIFYSHRMILSDRSFLKKMKDEVQAGESAISAATSVIGEYIKDFQKMEDPHFRERSADLEDLRQRILEHLVGRKKEKLWESSQGVLVAETLVPSDTTQLQPEKVQAIVTERGGTTSHAAIIARSLGIPAVMGIPGIFSKIQPGDLVIVDGNVGTVYINPEPDILREYEKVQEKFADQIVHLQALREEPAVTVDGHKIRLEANAGLVSGLKSVLQLGAEGVGLYRTELPFMLSKKLLSEEEQYQLYQRILREMQGSPVTFRLLDVGADKPLEALNMPKEANPFLGFRSIRLTLSRPEILKTQLRALLRVSSEGPIRILIPMVSRSEEVWEIKKILEAAKNELRASKTVFDEKIPIGLMIEVPAAVWISQHLISECDFFSIGTNDLIQYTLAVDRNNEKVAPFFEPLHPAVLSAIGHVCDVARRAGKPISICGEMAGEPLYTPLLVGLGVTSLSMIPFHVPLVKDIIRHLSFQKTRQLAEAALKESTTDGIKKLLKAFSTE